MIDAGKLEVIERVFQSSQFEDLKNIDSENYHLHPESQVNYRDNSSGKPYQITEGGIAVIPVVGSLMHRAYGFAALSGIAGYNRIESMVSSAAKDPEVNAIAFDSDSPGGMVAGLYQLTDLIREIDQNVKPVWSIINESSYSASYAISSSTRRIVGPETSGSGSIGVIMLHADQSKFDSEQGVKYTAIYAGKHKNEFTPHAPLSKDAKERAQAEVNYFYDLFVSMVSVGRPMTEEEIRNTEAATFHAKDALEIGLIDDIMTFDQAIQAMTDEYSRSSINSVRVAARNPNGDKSMTTQSKPEAATAPAADGFTQAELDQAKAEGIREGAKSERDRVSAIINCEAAKDRKDQAITIALESDMTADQASNLLAKMPLEKSQSATGFSQAMSQIENPTVGADAGEQSEGEDLKTRCKNIVALVQPV